MTISLHNYQEFLVGTWQGSWQNYSNVKVKIEIVEGQIKGYYDMNKKIIHFTGYIAYIDKSSLEIKFNPPMEKKSGGFFYFKDNKLQLYCLDIKHNFVKISDN